MAETRPKRWLSPVIAPVRDIAVPNHGHAAALPASGVTVVELDVTDDNSVEHAVANVLAQSVRIDALTNNAGIASAGVVSAESYHCAFSPDFGQNTWNVALGAAQSAKRSSFPLTNINSELGRIWPPRERSTGTAPLAHRHR